MVFSFFHKIFAQGAELAPIFHLNNDDYMAEWFVAKVKYLRQMDNGLIKQHSEQYLVDSMSFTECETRVMKEVGEGMREVTMMAIAKSPIKEIVPYGDTEIWFKCKVQYIDTDEETEKQKKVTTYLLVNANDAKEAYERTEVHLKYMLVPFSIPKVEESPIVDVFEHRAKAKQPETIDESHDGTTVEIEGQKMTIRSVQPIIPPMLDTGCDMHTEAVEASNPANGKAHKFEVPDEWSAALFIDLLETPAYVRVSDQHSALPFEEFKTWVMAAHELTESQAIELNDLLSC